MPDILPLPDQVPSEASLSPAIRTSPGTVTVTDEVPVEVDPRLPSVADWTECGLMAIIISAITGAHAFKILPPAYRSVCWRYTKLPAAGGTSRAVGIMDKGGSCSRKGHDRESDPNRQEVLYRLGNQRKNTAVVTRWDCKQIGLEYADMIIAVRAAAACL